MRKPRDWLHESNAIGTGEDGARFMRKLIDADANHCPWLPYVRFQICDELLAQVQAF